MQELEDILDDEHEMAAMYLSRRAEQSDAAAAALAAAEAAATASERSTLRPSQQDFSRTHSGGTGGGSGRGTWAAADLPAVVEGEAVGEGSSDRFTADENVVAIDDEPDLDEARDAHVGLTS